MDIDFTIIIPIYNAELYIDECLKSIMNQTYSRYEVVMVDDGSTDNSMNICKKYKNADNRFKFFNKANSGVSATRNFGIDNASNRWIIFVDADDLCEINMLETLAEYIHKSINDNQNVLLTFSYSCKYRNKTKIMEYSRKKNKEVDFEDIFVNPAIGSFVWNKVFDRDTIRDNSITFEENIYMGEDMLFVADYIQHTSWIYYVDKCLYTYRQRRGSAMHQLITKKIRA